MTKFGGLFGRKTGLYDRLDEPAAESSEDLMDDRGGITVTSNTLEVDEELFTALGVQMGNENELLRNLLLDAHAKVGELEGVRLAVNKLVDPVTKALRAFETEKSEKLNLQTVLNNTRAAYGKARNEVAELEKRVAVTEKECRTLRQELTSTQSLLRTVETTKTELAAEIASRKAEVGDLEARLAHETSEAKILRDENRRLDERLTTTDKRIIAIEADFNATRQRLTMVENEKQAQQAALEKSTAEAAKLSRKLVEAEAAVAHAQGRLRHMEANATEINADRARLSKTLDEANEQHEHETANSRVRFETLQARASATEKLLIEAREHLLARAEEIREYERRCSEAVLERDTLQGRVTELEAERSVREAQFQEVDQSRTTLMERSASLARAFTAKEANLTQAEENIVALNRRIGELEAQTMSDRESFEQAIEELSAQLRREKLERSVVEGALETCRKDFSRVMRELMILQRSQTTADDPSSLRAANAA